MLHVQVSAISPKLMSTDLYIKTSYLLAGRLNTLSFFMFCDHLCEIKNEIHVNFAYLQNHVRKNMSSHGGNILQ